MTDKEDLDKSVDSVTEQEKDYGIAAFQDFQKGNYGSCLQYINKLEQRAFDFKVAHNKIVIEYYKTDLKKSATLQKNISALYSQFRLRFDKLDDVDHCFGLYNYVVILFHQRQYTQALRLMEGLYKFMEPMDESLAQQVGLLLLELQIRTRQLHKAMSLLNFLENQLFNNNPLVFKGERLLKFREPKEKKVIQQPVVIDPVIEEFKKKLVKYKATCFLLKHNLEPAKKEIQNLFAQDKTSIAGLFLNANYEYLLENYKESMSILNNIPPDCLTYSNSGESAQIMLHNNLGAIHHAMGKYNIACHYYQSAIKLDISLNEVMKKEHGEVPLHTLGSSRYQELVYNLGISLLHAGRPASAFDCLVIAVRRYHRNSRLWLRLAECCIQLHKKSNEVDFDLTRKQNEIVVQIIGSKKHQKVMLTKHLVTDKKYGADSQSYAVPVPTLEFAVLCLRNALLLLPSETASSPLPLLLIPGVTPPPPPPTAGPAPSSPLSRDTIAALRNSILASSAYVSLCVGDYLLALEYAKLLLAQPKLTGSHKLLGHLYAAESLVLLDKLSEALEHLNPENVKDITLQLEAENIDPEEQLIKNNPPAKWFPTTLASAHAVMQYNIAVCKTLQGQLDQASALLKQIWKSRGSACKVPAVIIMLVLYIELQLGHADVARSLIKQYSLQCKING